LLELVRCVRVRAQPKCARSQSYEDLIASTTLTVDRSRAFLALPPARAHASLDDAHARRPLRDAISNYADVERALRGTAFAWMLE
jgi:hypothetical protein